MSIPPERLAPVLAAPHDDAPRLALAQALTDDPQRAAFIRLQLRRAASMRAWDDSRLGLDLAEERDLYRPDFDEAVRALGFKTRMERGFVQYVAAEAALYQRSFTALRALAPVLELALSEAAPTLPRLLDEGLLSGLTALDLTRNPIGDAGAALLAQAPGLEALRWLDLRWCGLSRVGLEALCASPLGRQLRWLHVRGRDFSDPHDQPIDEDGRLIEYQPTPLGEELEAQHGPLPWLHHHPRRLRFFPPPMSQFCGPQPVSEAP